MRQTMSRKPSGLLAVARRALWQIDLDGAPVWKTFIVQVGRVVLALVRDLAEGQLTLRAMSLVYTTLLSLVPLLAISFSVLKGFGVHNQIEPFLLNFLAPLGSEGVRITEQIIGFVDNVKVGVLGFLGFALLFYTVVSLMQKIELAFNYAWHVIQERTFAQRVRDYLSVLVVGPVLIFLSIGITGSLMSAPVTASLAEIPGLGGVIRTAGTIVPYFMVVAAFTFIYMFVPNTTVQLRAALVGGLVAGVLWNSVGWVFASFVVGSAKYTAIYSTFATLIFFMIWLYIGWLILLLGASISFYRQHPEFLAISRGGTGLSNRVVEKTALLVMYYIGRHFYQGDHTWTAEALTTRLNVPRDAVDGVLDALHEGGLLAKTDEDNPTYLPARPLEDTPLKDVLDAVRCADEIELSGFDRLPPVAAVEDIGKAVETAVATALAGTTVKDFVTSGGGIDRPIAAE